MIQTELKRKKGIGAAHSGSSPFTSKLICEDCGGLYGPKVWHSTDKYRRVVYQCNGKIAKFQTEPDVIRELIGKMVRENSIRAQGQAEYEAKYNELAQRYEKTNDELNSCMEERSYRKGQILKLQAFADKIIKSKEVLVEWDGAPFGISWSRRRWFTKTAR